MNPNDKPFTVKACRIEYTIGIGRSRNFKKGGVAASHDYFCPLTVRKGGGAAPKMAKNDLFE